MPASLDFPPREIMKRSSPIVAIAVGTLLCGASQALASAPGAWAKLEAEARRACLQKSGLRQATVRGDTLMFDKHQLIFVRGVYPQKHMRGARGEVACLYDRTTRRAETVESKAR